MNRDTAVSVLARRLGRRRNIEVEIIEEMQLAQARLEMDPELRTSWFLLSESASTQTTVDDERVPVPCDFLQEAEQCALYVQDTSGTWYELAKGSLDMLRREHTDSGLPERYALVGDYFRLLPLPDAQYNVKMVYYKKAEVLSTNIENVWLKWVPDLLIAETGIAMALWTDATKIQLFSALRDQERGRLLTANYQRMYANHQMQMGRA